MPRSAPEKLTAAMWPKPRDASIHLDLTLDAEPMLAVMRAAEAAGYRLTVNAILSLVIGRILVEFPEINVDVRGGRLRSRDAVDVWVTMADEDGRLVGQRVSDLDERDVLDVQGEISGTGERLKGGDHKSAKAIFWLVKWLPHLVLRPLIRVIEFIIHTLRIPIPLFGISREGFGAVHITNVGPYGLRHAAAPIPPITGQSILVTVGEIHDAPVVRDGEVTVGRVLPLTGTIDHRVAVGLRASRWYHRFVEHMTDVDELLDLFDEEAREQVRAELDAETGEQPASAVKGHGARWST